MALGVPGGPGGQIIDLGMPQAGRVDSRGCPGTWSGRVRWGASATPPVPARGRGSGLAGQVRGSKSTNEGICPVSMDTACPGEAGLLLLGRGAGVRGSSRASYWDGWSEGAGARLERLRPRSCSGLVRGTSRVGWGCRHGAVVTCVTWWWWWGWWGVGMIQMSTELVGV